MKILICFDTEDEKGMENSIKMMDHLAKDYMNRRIVAEGLKPFGKIEFIKVLRIFASQIAEELQQPTLTEGHASGIRESQQRERYDWEGLKTAKVFADKVFGAKEGGKRIGGAGCPTSLLRK